MTDTPTLLNGRWPLRLPEHRATQWMQWPDGWEVERLDAMHDCIVPGDLVFDIGAEEGDLPALWALWGAQVVMVEPEPMVWPNIRTIFETNNLTERVAGCFVGFCGDELRARPRWAAAFQGTEQWPTCAYGPVIDNHGFLVIPERPEVPITTIDQLALEHGTPTVLTIDVEGAELSVLRGARRTLIEDRPRVFVSIHQDEQWMAEKFPGDTEDAVTAYMTGLGYTGRILALDHELHQEWQHPQGR